jgi:hypothetical protein
LPAQFSSRGRRGYREAAAQWRIPPSALASTSREVVFATGVDGEAGRLLVNLLSEDHSSADAAGQHCLLIEAYGYRWYRVGGLDYLLKRSDVEIDPEA